MEVPAVMKEFNEKYEYRSQASEVEISCSLQEVF